MKEENRPWGIHTIRNIIGSKNCQTLDPIYGYVQAVPEPYSGNRVVAAWWVLKGRARAIIWPTAGELAAAMGLPGPKPKRGTDRLSPWPEQRPERSEGDRSRIAEEMSAHLPKPDAFKSVHFSEDDMRAMKAAFIKRFDEELPRTETMMCVASIGYRMALRDNAAEILRLTEANEELIRGMTEMAERYTAAMDKATI